MKVARRQTEAIVREGMSKGKLRPVSEGLPKSELRLLSVKDDIHWRFAQRQIESIVNEGLPKGRLRSQ